MSTTVCVMCNGQGIIYLIGNEYSTSMVCDVCKGSGVDSRSVSMHETQKTISEWGFKTFGYPKSPISVIDRMKKEIDELEELKEQSKKYNDLVYPKMADECADIYIMLCHVMSVLGYDLQACVDHKMGINRARKWKLNGDGTGQHIKE